jgi:hypothetical protein
MSNGGDYEYIEQIYFFHYQPTNNVVMWLNDLAPRYNINLVYHFLS